MTPLESETLIVSATLRAYAELTEAKILGDTAREAEARARVDAWSRWWAKSLPAEEEA